jgi:hypothetical protein
MSRNRTFTYDAGLLLSDGATAVTASAAAQVASANQILFLGGGPPSTLGGPQDYGLFEGYLVIDLLTLDPGTLGLYTVQFQLSDSPTFASGIFTKTSFQFGNTTALPSGGATSSLGRYVGMVDNAGVEGTLYGYSRIYTSVSGTISTGSTFRAFLAPLMGAGQ